MTVEHRRRLLISRRRGRNSVAEHLVAGEPTSAGNTAIRLFGSDSPPQLPVADLDLAGQSIIPPVTGVRVAIVIFGSPADRASSGAVSAPAELAQIMDSEGTHQTDSVDVGVVVSGRVTLRVPGQPDVVLEPGDTFVQAGAPHSWHNESGSPCVVVMTMIGAHPDRTNGV